MLHDPNHPLLFPRFSNTELEGFMRHGLEVQLAPAEVLVKQGDSAYHFWIVKEGQIQITKRLGLREEVLTVHQPGEFIGEISLLTGAQVPFTARALDTSRVIEIQSSNFNQFLIDYPAYSLMILSAMMERAKERELLFRQQEKLAALGKLSAGLAHELNNPAAAGQRAAKQLRHTVATLQSNSFKLLEQELSPSQRQLVKELQQAAIAHYTTAPPLPALVQSDREELLADWLEQRHIPNGWQLAPTLVAAGMDEQQLQPLTAQISSRTLEDVLIWLETSITLNGLVNTVERSTARISELVKAIKAYSFMDQAPLQEIDIHEGVENTLFILQHKLNQGITVERQYDSTLPRICVYGSELNQVWTNLIENGIDALQELKASLEEAPATSLSKLKAESDLQITQHFIPTIWIRT
ncbi:MAG: cyclic nucleotide-binding domain-containing protein, partial [Chroococcidiopsidaceae cyanobacterium CP_BM_ER_R8_30]|nr:cyclic nucleotide-binding domain-containing protein [Chroococcidiopsidaceae cyanobacterium CP_BM_ER_R8_30]